MKNTNFSIQKIKLKLDTLPKIKKYFSTGKIKIEIITTAGAHNYGPVGSKLTLSNLGMVLTTTSVSGGVVGGNNLNFDYFKVISSDETVEDLKNAIAEIKAEIKESKEQILGYEEKLNYLKETNSEKFNENEYKAFSVLGLLEQDSLSKLEKAKIIAKLIE